MKTKSRLILLAGCCAAALACAGALRTDLLLSHGFGKALEGSRQGLSFEVTAPAPDAQAVGDERYWLTRAQVESPAPFAKPLVVGDRITINGADGRERRLEVVELKPVGAPLAKVDNEPAPMRLLLVTCRVVDGTEQDAAPVRFIIEGVAAEPALPAQKAL